jgi:uncharacterized membrane protein
MEGNGKKLWLSKTFWVNVIALIAMVLQYIFGFITAPEDQVMILGVINIILRLVTKEEIGWKAKE